MYIKYKESLMVLINSVHHNYYPKMLYVINIILSITKHLETF
jgi:hypothetical protein